MKKVRKGNEEKLIFIVGQVSKIELNYGSQMKETSLQVTRDEEEESNKQRRKVDKKMRPKIMVDRAGRKKKKEYERKKKLNVKKTR